VGAVAGGEDFGAGLFGGLTEAMLLCRSRIGLSYSSIDIVLVRSILWTLCIGTDETAQPKHNQQLYDRRRHDLVRGGHETAKKNLKVMQKRNSCYWSSKDMDATWKEAKN